MIGLLTLPLINHSQVFHRLLSFLVALAVGTLVGDALLHLLPHVRITTFFIVTITNWPIWPFALKRHLLFMRTHAWQRTVVTWWICFCSWWFLSTLIASWIWPDRSIDLGDQSTRSASFQIPLEAVSVALVRFNFNFWRWMPLDVQYALLSVNKFL